MRPSSQLAKVEHRRSLGANCTCVLSPSVLPICDVCSHIFVLRVVILIVIDLYVAPSSARARSAVAAAVRGAGGPNVVAVANESKGAALCAALAIPSCKRNEGAIKKAKDRRQ